MTAHPVRPRPLPDAHAPAGGRLAAVALLGLAGACLDAAVAADAVGNDRPAAHDRVLTVRPGQVCRGLPPVATEVSCGTIAFGDVRYHCPRTAGSAADADRCPVTVSVTVRNTGSRSTRVTVISGSAPGQRDEQRAVDIGAGRSAVLRTGHGDRYLYDIVLGTTERGPTDLTVVTVR